MRRLLSNASGLTMVIQLFNELIIVDLAGSGQAMGGSAVASKLMKQMGYQEGRGLGLNEQGITQPISLGGSIAKHGLGHEARKVVSSLLAAFKPINSSTQSMIQMSSGIRRWRKKMWKNSRRLLSHQRRYATISNEIFDMTGLLKETYVTFDNLGTDDLNLAVEYTTYICGFL
jgi:hypothetical protein